MPMPSLSNGRRFSFLSQIFLSFLSAWSFSILQVQFILQDDGGLTSGVLTLTLKVIRNSPPTLTLPQTTLDMNSNDPVGRELLRCSATDPDTRTPFNTLSFSLIGDITVMVSKHSHSNSHIITLSFPFSLSVPLFILSLLSSLYSFSHSLSILPSRTYLKWTQLHVLCHWKRHSPQILLLHIGK